MKSAIFTFLFVAFLSFSLHIKGGSDRFKFTIPFPQYHSPLHKATSPRIAPSLNHSNDGLRYEANKGQWPIQVHYTTDLSNGARVFFENDRFTYVLHDQSELNRIHEESHEKKLNLAEQKIRIHAFEMQFVDANLNTQITAQDTYKEYRNYFIGNDPSKWASEVPLFKTIFYNNIYPGIDLKTYSEIKHLKYDYIVNEGADASIIKLAFNGADKLSLKDNNLCILTSVGEVVESVPYAYQLIDGKEVKVECRYHLSANRKIVSFEFPNGYDKRYKLIIDPVLVASTYSGSTAQNYGHCATYDAAGNIYTGARSFGTGYPVTIGAVQSNFVGANGSVDIAISKLNPTGSALIYATYLGGNSQDLPHSLFVDSNNELFIYGSSSSNNYPTTTNAYDISANGNEDMIVSKLNSTGTVLLGSTFIGGTSDDAVNNGAAYSYGDNYRGEIIIDQAGNVFIAGTTNSSDFPATTGAYDASFNGAQDAVLLKMNSSLTSLLWATFLGGAQNEAGCSVRVNGAGDVYIVGLTQSTGFPSTTGAINSAYMGGQYDGFISRFNSSGNTLLGSSFIGTTVTDIVYFVEVDQYNGVYIYGVSGGAMPITTGVYSVPNSQNFLMKLNSALTSITYATVLGGGTHSNFSPAALMVDLCENVYMSGWGTTTNYPVTSNAIQSNNPGNTFYLMVLSQNASTLLYGSFFGVGGEHVDGGTSRFDPNGVVYQAVCEGSTAYPTTPTAYSPTKATAGYDITVFKINFEINCNPISTSKIICSGSAATLSITNVYNLSYPTYSLAPGNFTSTTGVFVVSPPVTSTYSVFVTGTNAFNVVVTNTGIATVTVIPQPVLTPTILQASCTSSLNAFNLGLTFIPSTATPIYNVAWSNIPNVVNSLTQTIGNGGINPGFYQATVTTGNTCSATANFTINPVPANVSFTVPGPFVVTCANPVITLNAFPNSYNYFWSSTTMTATGASASFTAGNQGPTTVTAIDPTSGCVGTQTFMITQDLNASSSTVTPLSQNITCSMTAAVTITAIASPSVNISHYWLSPFGGTLTAMNGVSIYTVGPPGTYTHVVINNVNGCVVTKTFSITSNSGFPTYSVSSPQNFTLGCSTKSIATINITNAQTTPFGGPVSYTILSPSSNGNYVTAAASSFTNITEPGTYTVITKDNTNFCESKIQISVIQNTFAPHLDVTAGRRILTCEFPSVVLQAISTNTAASFAWSFPGTPGVLPSDSIRVNTNGVSTSSLVANYTLTVTDNNNSCKSGTVIPVYQNTFKPKVSFGGAMPITCKTATVNLSNTSETTIIPFFFPTLPVVGYEWRGPTPQEPLQLSTTYTAFIPGTYTLIGMDRNNGCTNTFTALIEDNRDYPGVNNPDTPGPFILDCGASGASIYPIITGLTSNLTYSWLPVKNTAYSSLTTPTTVVDNVGVFNVLVTNTINGCQSAGFVEVIQGTLDAQFVSTPVTGFAPLTVTFDNLSHSTSNVTGTKNITSYWSFGNGITLKSLQVAENVSTLFKQPGTYSVVLYATKGDCVDSTMHIIKVELPSLLEIPNVFSPNNDGKNDEFFLRADNLTEINMTIVDRWGHTVYEISSQTGNVEWNGKNQAGVDVAEGVYLYKLTAKGLDLREFDQNGTITLVR